MEKRNDSDSKVQQDLEIVILEKFLEKENLTGVMHNDKLIPLKRNPKVKIKPDFYSDEQHIIGEIHTHLGKLKSAQIDKIAADVLKLLLFEKDYGETFIKFVVVCDEEEEKQLKGNSFLAEAITQFDVKISCVTLSSEDKENLKRAMEAQNFYREGI